MNKLGWLRKTPIISLLFAVAIASVPYLLADDPAHSQAKFQDTREEARAFLTRNPRLEVDVLGERIVDRTWLVTMRAAAARSDESGLDIRLPPRLLARSQARLDDLMTEAYAARMKADPAWRLGVLDAQSPSENYLAHVFVQGNLAGIVLCVLVLLIVGTPLERTWGSPIFGAFVVGAALATAQAYRLLDASSGVPWQGGAGLAGALLGAYFIRGLGGHFALPGWVLMPAWLGVETFVVRGFWIDDFGSVPWATLAAAIGFGALVGGGLRVLNVEAALDARAAKRKSTGTNPVVVRAARMRSDGDPYQAFDLIQAAWRDDPKDADVCEIFFSIAVEVGQPEVAAKAILPGLRFALKRGDLERALDYWYPLAAKECEVDLEATAFVRLAEGLLDASHPEEALFSLRSALAAGVSSSHATRIVHIARDLDEGLAREAATIALTDPNLDPKSRSELENMALVSEEGTQAPPVVESAVPEPSRSPLDRRVQAEHQTVETTSFPLDLDVDVDLEPGGGFADEDPRSDFSGELTEAGPDGESFVDEALYAGALSPANLAAEVGGGRSEQGADSGDVLSHWNDSTAIDADALGVAEAGLAHDAVDEALMDVGDLETPDLGFDFGLRAGAPDLIGMIGQRDDETDSDLTPMMDVTDEVTSPMSASCGAALLSELSPSETSTAVFDQTTQVADVVPKAVKRVASSPAVSPVAANAPLTTADEQSTTVLQLRSLKAVEAVPVEASESGLEIDVDDRGKSKLPYARIEAMSIAAISGLGPRPVLVIDFVLNWRAAADEPMKLIRLRSDRFDPREYAQADSPLAALTAWVIELERLSGAQCLPTRGVLEGNFSRYASLADYEREVLMASSFYA